jgi:hypothetical protein
VSKINVNTIANLSGTTAATIDSAGNVSASGTFLIDDNHPYFYAQGSSVFQSAAYLGTPSTFTAVRTWNTVTLNQANLLNTANGYMEVPAGQAGIYEYRVNSNSGTVNAHRGMYVFKISGSSITNLDSVFSNNDYSGYTLASHKMLNLAAGDKILVGYHNSYDSFNVNDIYTSFFGRRIK